MTVTGVRTEQKRLDAGTRDLDHCTSDLQYRKTYVRATLKDAR